jgi:hypothetical protein
MKGKLTMTYFPRLCALAILSLISLKAVALKELDSQRLDKLFLQTKSGLHFTEKRWKAQPLTGVEFPRNARKSMLPDLVHKCALIGLSLNELCKLLGEPSTIDEPKQHLVYELNFPECNSAPQFYLDVELKQGRVWRFRIKEINPVLPGEATSYSTWVTSNFISKP